MMNLADIGLPPKGVLVDIGASRGEFFRAAAALMFPNQSLCVEMLDDLAAALKADLMFHDPANGRHVSHRACGETRSVMEAHRLNFDPASSLLPCNEQVGRRLGHDMSRQKQEVVLVTTLDFLCGIHDITHIDLLKIDVQGYESRVLRGAKRILPHVDRVIVEVLLFPHYEGQSDPDEIRSLLNAAGLRLTRELHRDTFPDTGELLEVDELFERI
jgi:FkbM family methyltransferase